MKPIYFDTLTLDIDNYNFRYLINNLDIFTAAVVGKIKPEGTIRVLKGQKGYNLIIDTEPLNFLELIFLRIAGADDLFRVRNDIIKFFKKEYHRINRIWEIKNGISKQEIFKGNLEQFEEFLKSFIPQIKEQLKEVEK